MILEAAVVCLALTMHYEASIDPLEGQLAVALATLNRAKHVQARVCNEVFRPGAFEWTAEIPAGPKRGLMLRYKSAAVVSLTMHDFTDGATHFCHFKYHCSWEKDMTFAGRWGSHNFYKPRAKK